MALSKPLVDGRTKLKLQFTTLGTKRELLLNNYNVEQIFKVVSLTTGGREYDSTLGGLLDIPYKSQSDPVGSADIYIKGRYRSWRRIIFCLDHVDEPSFADELIPYAEPQADPFFTVERVTPIFTKLRNWARIETTGSRYIIIVPDARVKVICSQYPSPDDQQKQAASYYVNCRLNASWSQLAKWLYMYEESAAAIETFKLQLPTPQDRTLTPENVLAKLQEVQLWERKESSHNLDMPYATHDNLIDRHGDGAPGKSAVVNEYLSNHPYPRWDQINGLLTNF